MTTLIWNLARSLAMGKVIPSIAPFVPPYSTCPLCPSIPAILATFTITPRSPSSGSCLDICSAQYLLTVNVPNTFIRKILWKSSEGIRPDLLGGFKNYLLEENLEIIVLAWIIPAEFRTTWILPNFSTVLFTKFFTLSSSATFVFTNNVFAPNSFSRFYPAFSFISAITTYFKILYFSIFLY